MSIYSYSFVTFLMGWLPFKGYCIVKTCVVPKAATISPWFKLPTQRGNVDGQIGMAWWLINPCQDLPPPHRGSTRPFTDGPGWATTVRLSSMRGKWPIEGALILAAIKNSVRDDIHTKYKIQDEKDKT